MFEKSKFLCLTTHLPVNRLSFQSLSAAPGTGLYAMIRPSPSPLSSSRSFGGREELERRRHLASSASENSLMGALSQVGLRSTTPGSIFLRLELPDLLEHGPVRFQPRSVPGLPARLAEVRMYSLVDTPFTLRCPLT